MCNGRSNRSASSSQRIPHTGEHTQKHTHIETHTHTLTHSPNNPHVLAFLFVPSKSVLIFHLQSSQIARSSLFLANTAASVIF